MNDLVVELSLPGSIVTGALLVGEVMVRNDGGTAATVSAWLGLLEGDLSLHIRDPAGRDRTVHGRYQLDVLPQAATLDGGTAIARGVQLSVTSVRRLFDQPGAYQLRATYTPSVQLASLESDAHTLVVEPAGTAEQRAVAVLFDPEVVGDAVALGHVDAGSPAAANLERLATEHPERLEAAAARILMAGSEARDGAAPAWDAAFRGLEPLQLARLVTALQPPAGASGDPLVVAALGHVTTDAAATGRTRAAAMLRGEPFDPADPGS